MAPPNVEKEILAVDIFRKYAETAPQRVRHVARGGVPATEAVITSCSLAHTRMTHGSSIHPIFVAIRWLSPLGA